MKDINKVFLIGSVGQDPDVRFTSSGTQVSSFSLATSEKYKDKSTGEKHEKTTWNNIVAFGRLAEIVGEYVRKGSRLYIEGSLDNQQYDKDGVTHHRTKIMAKDISLLGDAKAKEGKEVEAASKKKETVPSQMTDFEDDDIPF